MLWIFFLFSFLLGATPSQAQQVSFLNITAPYHNFSSTCISVLNSVVPCSPKVAEYGGSGSFPPDNVLSEVCTTTCASGLANWVRRAAGACGTSRFTDGTASYLAAYLAETVLESYSVLCLKNPQGQFCKAVFRTAISAAAASASATQAPSSIACNSCALSMLSTQLQMPIGNSMTELKTQYASMTSSCKVSNMAITSLATTTKWVTMAPQTTAAPGSCVGTEYTVKAGDNCRSVSLSQGISTNDLLTVNELQSYCANFPAAGSRLCIPTAKKCKPYQLKADLSDDCSTIASAENLKWVQVVSWNPEVGEYCENLPRLAQDGHVICVSMPGGEWVNPFPEEPESTTTSEPETWFTLPQTDFNALPTAIPYDPPYPNSGYVNPFANDTILDCALHREPPVVPVAQNNSVASYSCQDFAEFYGITLAQLVEWNPSLANQVDGGGDCTLFPGEQYCARRDDFSSTEGIITKYCNTTEIADSGPQSFCDGFIEYFGLQKSDFLDWNPGVGSQCEKFHSGMAYCTSVRGFRPGNTISTCSRWHQVEELTPGTDACMAIETRYGLQHARFVAWNPNVKSDCSGIKVNYEYCVGTPQFPGLP